MNAKLDWSSEQIAIFNWFKVGKGNLVVRARAGTGKTTTIKEAFGHAPEARMLYAVFNKKNQIEAAAKIVDPRVEVKTLHALGYRFIKQYWRNARPDDKVEWDRVDSAIGFDMVSEVVRADVHKLVGFAKNMLINPGMGELVELAKSRDLGNDESDALALAKYASRVLDASCSPRQDSRISFNDMVYLPVRMGWVRPWFDIVVIDEAQDMNLPQLTMARLASKGRVCVVGDDRQAIYGFRGAVQDGMAYMQTLLGASELGLTLTYRCPKRVVALAQEFVPDYRVGDTAPEGVVREADEDQLLVSVEVGDAILSRANAPLMPLCLALLRRGVSAMIEGRDVGKMLVSLAKKLKARSVPDFLARVKVWRDRMVKRASKADGALKESKIAEYEDQAACLEAVAEDARSVQDVLDRLDDLFRDSEGERRPMVVLSSVHKAKGLEWDNVFLLRDTFMRTRPGSSGANQEEVNIYYVAMTRAKRTLVMVSGK